MNEPLINPTDVNLQGANPPENDSPDLSLPARQPDVELLMVAFELKSAFDDFRKAIVNTLEQKRIGKHIRDPVWLNSREAEQLLKISSRTLRRYREQNLINYYVNNSFYRYRYTEIISFLKKK